LHKAFYSGHNDHNYFEIAHTVKRLYDMAGGNILGLRLYNFVDNHDVERIYTKLNNKAHMIPVHILLYTLPGVPSLYYGSEFGIEGRKEKSSDASLRPALSLDDYKNAINENVITKVIAALGKVRQDVKALSYGGYRELSLTTRQYAFSRKLENENVIIAVNNDDNDAWFNLPAEGINEYVGVLSGEKLKTENGSLNLCIRANYGDIFLPLDSTANEYVPISYTEVEKEIKKEEAKKEETKLPEHVRPGVAYEEMTIEELQLSIINKMSMNGPVTDEMRRTVMENVYHDSLVNWVKSFR
ncbi:MAG: alpha-amylase, partial [Lachnospiraceae bacterium]|nr:alpha-amylase [Lachnospiraceae bacterium]